MDEYAVKQIPTLTMHAMNSNTDLTGANDRFVIIVKYPTTGQDIEMPLYTKRPSK